MYPTNDNEYRDHTIEKVDGDSKHGWGVTFDNCTGFFIPSDSPIEPKVGMVMRQYGRGIGFVVRGCFLDGVKVFYRTKEEQDAHNAKLNREHEQAMRDEFEKNRADMDRRYEALPPIFRARLDKFRNNNPEFRWKFEGYELFVCEQAVLIADNLKTFEAIDRFHQSDSWESQKAAVPGLDNGHSGNTFDMACRLAIDYVTHPERVQQRHGALAPLVGSKEYGCVPRTEGDIEKHAQQEPK